MFSTNLKQHELPNVQYQFEGSQTAQSSVIFAAIQTAQYSIQLETSQITHCSVQFKAQQTA
jgi:hypothetical protein